MKLLNIDKYNATYILKFGDNHTYKDEKFFTNFITRLSKKVAQKFAEDEMEAKDNLGELHIIFYNPYNIYHVRFIYLLTPLASETLPGFHSLELINVPDFGDIFYKLAYNERPDLPIFFFANFRPKPLL